MSYEFYKLRRYDSDCFIFEFDNKNFRLDTSIGERYKLEKLSKINGEPNENEHPIAKINGGFFTMGSTQEFIGSYVDEGLYYQGATPYYPTLIYWKDSKKFSFEINPDQTRHAYYQKNAYFAIGVPWALVINGKEDHIYDKQTLIKVFGHPYTRQPRTLIGQRADGTIIFAVIDGRTTNSLGITITQSSELMLSLGCENACNLDGGGSSEMIVGKDIVNNLSDGSERSIGTAFLCYAPKTVELPIVEYEFRSRGIVYNLIPGDILNVRTGPSTGYKKIASLPNDTNVKILATNVNGKWYKIELESGAIGWASKNFVKALTGTTLIPCRAYILSDEIPMGAKFNILNISEEYYTILIDNVEYQIPKEKMKLNL